MSEVTRQVAANDGGVDDPGMSADTPRLSGSVASQDSDLLARAANADGPHGARETEIGTTIHATARRLVNRGPLIDAIEALAGAIRQKIDGDRSDPPAFFMDAPGERPAADRTAVSLSELGPLIEAVEVQVREIRHELGLAQPATLAPGADPWSEEHALTGFRSELDRERLPLIDALETRIRGIRTELGLSSEAGVETLSPTAPDEIILPPAQMELTLPAFPSKARTVGDSSRKPGHASRRWPWLIATAAILLLVAAAVGVRLTRDGQLPKTEAGRPPTTPPVSAETPTATPPPPIAPSAGTNSSATPLPGPSPLVPSSPGAADAGRDGPPAAVTSAESIVREPDGTRSIVTPAAPVAPAAAPSPTPSESSPPSGDREGAGAARPNVGPPAAPLPANDGLAIPAPSSPVAGSAASPATEANSASLSLTRPAVVLTRVQPRMRVDVLSGEMSAEMEVEVEIDRAGRPHRVRAVSGPAALRAQAEDIVGHWTFSPALQGGEPVEGALRVSLRFGPAIRDMRFGRRSR